MMGRDAVVPLPAAPRCVLSLQGLLLTYLGSGQSSAWGHDPEVRWEAFGAWGAGVARDKGSLGGTLGGLSSSLGTGGDLADHLL